jgi:hypothetical protein
VRSGRFSARPVDSTSTSPTVDGAEQGIAGLVQRATIIEVQTWYVLMGWLAHRGARDRRSTRHADAARTEVA